MYSNFAFNESLKRLEPCEKTCIYCAENEFEKMEDCYFAPIYKVKNRLNVIVASSVSFSEINVGIPRCRDCKGKHEKVETTILLYGLAAFVATFTILFLLFSSSGKGVAITVGLLISPLVGIFTAMSLRDSEMYKTGICSPSDGAETTELVQELLWDGWTLQRPNPRGE